LLCTWINEVETVSVSDETLDPPTGMATLKMDFAVAGALPETPSQMCGVNGRQ
jgi:hypothetical protein